MTMEAAKWQDVYDEFKPTDDDEHSVVIIQYDEMNAFSDPDYITAPYKYDTLEDGIPMPPEKSQVSYTILHQDGRMWEVSSLREVDDPPEWVEEFETE